MKTESFLNSNGPDKFKSRGTLIVLVLIYSCWEHSLTLHFQLSF